MAIPAPALTPRTLKTVDQYLAMERPALERHTFLDGDILVMAGESDAHGDISVNLLGGLVPQLKGTSCRASTKDSKIRSALAPLTGHGSKGLFFYPDIVVICGELEHHDAYRDIILNPKPSLKSCRRPPKPSIAAKNSPACKPAIRR